MRNEVDGMLRHYIDAIKVRSKSNLNDGAVDAEGFFCNLLNILYGFNLSKDKIGKAHNKTIDLHCLEEKMCIQITAQNNRQKLNRTVRGFIKSEHFKIYSQLYFLILDREKKFTYDTEKLKKYEVEIFILDYSTIFQKLVTDFDCVDKMVKVYDFVMKELDMKFAHTFQKEKFSNESNYADKSDLKDLHIVDQLYKVIKAFEGFYCIHPRTLSKLYPFNIESRTFDAYSNYCLKTSNKGIHELLQKIKIDEFKQLEISDETLLPYADKLREIFVILNHSLVYCICYREKYTEVQHYSISIDKSITNCTCNQCLYQKFDTGVLLDTLKEKAISHSNNLSNALSEGYYLCKLGEHIKGWQVFNSIVYKSGNQKEQVIHFLAQHNCYAIYNFIDSPWWENEAKAILPKILEIDLYETLCRIKVPLVVRDELIKVKDDYHLNFSRERIEEQAGRIHSIKILYANRGYNTSSPPVEILKRELHLLFTFYTTNGIIADDFFTFKTTITKGVEALFESYTTDDRYEYKYKKFDNFIITLILFYVDEDSLKRILSRFEIHNIEINDVDRKDFIKTMINFFTSQYTTNKWEEVKFKEELNKQPYFSHYRQLLRQVYSRAMLILSKVDLESKELNSLTQPFTDFLYAIKNMNGSDWAFLAMFLKKHIQGFDEKQIKAIIHLIVSEKNLPYSSNALHAMCNSLAESNFLIHDLDFFSKLTNNEFDDYSSGTPGILALWQIADKKGKSLIRRRVVKRLEKSFNADLYQNGIFLNIFHKENLVNLFQLFVTYTRDSCNEFDLKREKGHWVFQNYTGFNCVNCLLYMNVNLKEREYQLIAEKSTYYNWLINHENFDYTDFDFKWLTEACPYYLKVKLYQIESLSREVVKELASNYNDELAIFFSKYFFKKELDLNFL